MPAESNIIHEGIGLPRKTIWLCVTPGGNKDLGIRQQLLAGNYQDSVIISTSAHKLKEADYNDLLTQYPEMVALVKVEQTLGSGQNLRTAITGLLKNTPNAHRIKDAVSGDVILVANDIMLHIWKSKGKTWEPKNKMEIDMDKYTSVEQQKYVINQWMNSLSASNINPDTKNINLKFILGAAGISAQHRRGLIGRIEVDFEVVPFAKDELIRYYETKTADDLSKTNFAIDWVDPIMRKHIVAINGIPVNWKKQFSKEFTYLQDVFKGRLPGVNNFIHQIVMFASAHGLGREKAEVERLSKDLKVGSKTLRDTLKSWGVPTIGEWGRWYPIR